jgi:hypothetical protein
VSVGSRTSVSRSSSAVTVAPCTVFEGGVDGDAGLSAGDRDEPRRRVRGVRPRLGRRPNSPAITVQVVAGLTEPRFPIEVEAIAVLSG